MHADTCGYTADGRRRRQKSVWARLAALFPKFKRAAAVKVKSYDGDADFGWVPSWLTDPPPPTPTARRAAELLRELRSNKSR
jgi:hypothetical protein